MIILAPYVYLVPIFERQAMHLCMPEHLCAIATGELCVTGEKGRLKQTKEGLKLFQFANFFAC